MKPEPSVHDVADGIERKLGALNGVSDIDVTASGSVISVTGTFPPAMHQKVRDITASYNDSGFTVSLDLRGAR
ncbi:MAG: hypothetical protein HZB75_02840 [Candidatus Saccharibacteria bacterium]|nr:MAG: hypothetical protein HZB75_02840 [Candidatus Saccharibacteria bacterium]